MSPDRLDSLMSLHEQLILEDRSPFIGRSKTSRYGSEHNGQLRNRLTQVGKSWQQSERAYQVERKLLERAGIDVEAEICRRFKQGEAGVAALQAQMEAIAAEYHAREIT